MHLRNPKDFWSGIMFAAIGFAFAVIVKIYDYPMGSASRMGPGYFPFVLGMALGVLGLAILLKSFVTDGERVSALAWRPVVWILGAVIVFGLTVKLIGLALAIIVLVLISAFGGHEFKLKEQLIAGVILSIGSIGVFVYGLKLPFPIWPEFLVKESATMEALLSNLALGFSVAMTPEALMYCLIGCLLGTLIGVLPGIGPVATIAMLLPATFTLKPELSLIMLAGIYYGAQYGGSTTAILVNIPGESSSVVTALDGYQMARKGRAGAALGIAALGSFFAGCVATVLLAAAAPPLAEIAFKFGPAEYFSLMTLGLIAAVVLAHGSVIKAIGMILLGLLLGLVGTDVNSGMARFNFSIPELSDGIGFVAVAMGVFGFAEIIKNLEQGEEREIFVNKVGRLLPTMQDMKDAFPAVLRGTGLGSLLGILPGGGAVLASFSAYTLEKKLAKDSSQFGKGDIRGVAAPESANNAAAQTSFIPLLTLGIPPNPVMALMVGAMIIQGIQPGPQVMTEKPQLFWGMIVSMWIGNLMLVILNLPLIGMWIKLLTVPYRLLYPAILVFCCIGVYSLSNSPFDVVITAVFGMVGYLFLKLDCEPAPLLLGFILGPMMEENLRRAMLLSRGDATTFVTRPLSATLLGISLLLLVVIALPAIRKKREEAFVED